MGNEQSTSAQIPLRYCLYARKSSESDEKQALSIGSQITEMQRLAEKQGLDIVETIQESKSAKDSGQRAGFCNLMKGLDEGRFNAILTWAPDRLSRNAGDLGKLVDLMDQKVLVKIQTSGQTFSNTPDEKFLLMILCSQAKLENDNRSKNVKRGLRTRCEMGIRPGPVPVGYKLLRSEKYGRPSKIIIDPERAPFIKKAFEYVANSKFSGRQTKEYLEDEGFRSIQGKVVGLSLVYKIIKEPFYYGEFSYGGAIYQGTHKPIITKELFEQAQANLKTCEKGKWGRKDFLFNKILKCAECGSGVSGTTHINRHGTKYTYYKCNKYGGTKTCQCKYIREEKLFEEVAKIITRVKADHIRLNRRIEEDLDKVNRYRSEDNPVTIQEYLVGILESGSKKEKTDILRNFKDRLKIKDGLIILD
jgi:DNA invertase Pin-like site-specific DNA recombinase